MHLLIIGGSDAGISAALRAQDWPGAEITVLVAAGARARCLPLGRASRTAPKKIGVVS